MDHMLNFNIFVKQCLRVSNKINFERSVQKLEDFIYEEPGHEKLKD